MFAYYPIRGVYHGYSGYRGYGTVASVFEVAMKAAMLAHQERMAAIARKQAEHDEERAYARELELEKMRAQRDSENRAYNATVTGGGAASGGVPGAGGGGAMPGAGMTTGTKVGLGVGAVALLGAGAMLLRR